MAGLALGLKGAREGAAMGATYATNPAAAEIFDAVASVIRPRVLPNQLGNVRTALMFIKAEDAPLVSGVPGSRKKVQIAGSGHVFEQEVLQNEEERKKAIVAYAKYALENAPVVAQDFPGVSLDVVKNHILDAIAYFDVVKVTDPGGPDIQPDLPNIIQQPGIIELVGGQASPRITEWLRHLRPAT